MSAIKVYSKDCFPNPSKDDKAFSEDVIIYSPEDQMLNIGYYHFEDKLWRFHTDTLVDMDDVDFKWIYAPRELTGLSKIRITKLPK